MPDELEPDLYRNVLEELPAGLYVVDRSRRIVLWSKGAEDLTGYLSQEAMGRECGAGLLMHCDLEGVLFCEERCPLSAAMRNGHAVQSDAFLLHRDGSRIPVRLNTSPVHSEEGHVVGASTFFMERAPQLEEPLLERCHTVDPETQLPGYSALSRLLAAALKRMVAMGEGFGILLFAIDGLDNLLHVDGRNGTGAVFHTVGRTLAKNLGPGESLGRWSQNRLLGIVRACAPAALERQAEYLRKVARLASAPWWGERISVTVSASGALASPGDTPASLIERAEAVLTAGVGADGLALADDQIL
jgi:two-component system, cell cycle response regulator